MHISRFGPEVFQSARLAARAFKASSSVASAPHVINYGVQHVQPALAAADLENAIAGSSAPLIEPQVWLSIRVPQEGH